MEVSRLIYQNNVSRKIDIYREITQAQKEFFDLTNPLSFSSVHSVGENVLSSYSLSKSIPNSPPQMG